MKKPLKLFCSCILLFSALQAQEDSFLQKDDSMVVNSGEAQYDGKEIILVGQVSVQHSLGQISARRLSAQPSVDKDKKNKIGLLKISDHVQIALKGGGELHCEQAEVDYAKMQGVFLGNSEKPDVLYFNKNEGKEEKEGLEKPRPSFEIKSIKMILDLAREPATSTSSAKTLVKQVEADQHVRVRYNEEYLLLADRALYQRMPEAKSSMAGILTLTVQGVLPDCKMTNLNGDTLSARMIQLNTIERKLWLNQPSGILYQRREGRPEQTLEFSSQDLWWDDQQQTLLLKGQVELNQNSSLRINTDGEFVIKQAMENGKRTLRNFHSPENTYISYIDLQKGNTHKIYCPGSLNINHESQEMFLQGLKPTGKNAESRQVYIDDVLGEMHADDVHFKYRWENERLVPGKMVLEGNVRLINRFDGHMEESGSMLHYALADRVEFFPEQRELILNGVDGHRVLLFDKVNNVQMSAPSLKVRHDAATNKESIQGFGDVRFTFIEKELDQLKNHFPIGKGLQ